MACTGDRGLAGSRAAAVAAPSQTQLLVSPLVQQATHQGSLAAERCVSLWGGPMCAPTGATRALQRAVARAEHACCWPAFRRLCMAHGHTPPPGAGEPAARRPHPALPRHGCAEAPGGRCGAGYNCQAGPSACTHTCKACEAQNPLCWALEMHLALCDAVPAGKGTGGRACSIL